jgi:hypothetical protein
MICRQIHIPTKPAFFASFPRLHPNTIEDIHDSCHINTTVAKMTRQVAELVACHSADHKGFELEHYLDPRKSKEF